MSDLSLPEGFGSLEPFVAEWALSGSEARKLRRIGSTEPERLAFYESVNARAEEALNYLDRFPLKSLDPQQTRLLNLMLTYAHIALAVEKQGVNEPVHARAQARFFITRDVEEAHLG